MGLNYDDLGFAEIRILTLQPEKDHDAPICGELKTVRLSPRTRYRALSYCWGKPHETKPITVNGVEVQSTVNLETALRWLRADGDSAPVWIDSICINQGNLKERGIQVQQMRNIYLSAFEVIVWLGEEADGSDEAMSMLQSVQDRANVFAKRVLGAYGSLPFAWQAFDDLFARPYWRRVWIIQEIAVAAQIRVFCGSQQVDWKNIEITMDEINGPGGDPFFQRAASRTSFLLQVRKSFKCHRPMTLMRVLWMSQEFLATERLDRIYALLGVTRDGNDLVPYPDYSGTFEAVFRDLTASMIERHMPRDLIALTNSHDSPRALPSWVPEWDKLGDAPRPWQKLLILPDDESDTTDSDKEWLKKIGSPFTDWDLSSLYKVDSSHGLSVCGFVLAHIDGLTSSIVHPEDTMTQPDCRKLCYVNISVAVQNCMVLRKPEVVEHSNAHRNDGPLLLAGVFLPEGLKLMKESCPDFTQWFNVNKTFAIGDLMLRHFYKHQTGKERLKMKRDPVFSRTYISALCEVLLNGLRLFVSTKGHLGLAHAQAQRGDLVCYISGCRMPAILRPSKTGMKVIGEAYLHGYRERPPETTFTIV